MNTTTTAVSQTPAQIGASHGHAAFEQRHQLGGLEQSQAWHRANLAQIIDATWPGQDNARDAAELFDLVCKAHRQAVAAHPLLRPGFASTVDEQQRVAAEVRVSTPARWLEAACRFGAMDAATAAVECARAALLIADTWGRLLPEHTLDDDNAEIAMEILREGGRNHQFTVMQLGAEALERR